MSAVASAICSPGCARGVEPDYTGLDICKPMIERCRARFGRSAKFVIGDALTFVTDYTWDYIIASGIFGYNAKDTRKRLQPTLERLYDLSRIGLAVNFLSRRAPSRSPGRFYVHPADVLQFALNLTPAVRLDHSYLPNDFTVCLYRTLPWEAVGSSRRRSPLPCWPRVRARRRRRPSASPSSGSVPRTCRAPARN
jgi:hypothetical protein